MSERRPHRTRKRAAAARRPPPGSSPGHLLADPDAPPPVLQLIAYGPDAFEERPLQQIDEARAAVGRGAVTWINVDSLGHREAMLRLGEAFGLHRLALEDAVNLQQRPKVEEYGEHLFIVLRMPAPDGGAATEQLSMVLGEGYLLTFQERPGDCFEPVRQRLRQRRGRIREAGADYLAYALIDAAIDAYFPVLEAHGEVVEALEDELTAEPGHDIAGRVHAAKRDLLMLRRAIWPLREVVNDLVRDRSPRISETTALYLRDCYDHAVQLLDIVETYRDVASSLLDLHMAAVSARLNEAMKMLTVIATIFIPLSFIAGVYGMNFRHMPEFDWRYGYPFALSLMAAVAGGLFYYFYRRGWIGRRRTRPRD